MMNGILNHDMAIVSVVAFTTLLTRMLPFLLFGGKRKVPRWVNYLGGVLPPAVMAVLVIYCFRNSNWHQLDGFLPPLIAALVVALLHLWKRNNLVSIGVGTVVYMVLIQVVF